jgi:hypothetical protein
MFGFLKTILKAVLILTRVPKTISMIMEGIIQEVTEVPVGAAIGAISVSRLIQTFWVFGISNFFCGMKMMGSFTSCAMYYLLEVLGTILYLIPMVVFLFFDWITKDKKMGSYLEKLLWEQLEIVDRFTIENLGFHVIHFSQGVRDKCYNCRRLKPSAFISKTGDFITDLNESVIPLSIGGLQKMMDGITYLGQ